LVLNDSWPVNGKIALHLATVKNRVEATKFLIEKGIDINKPDLDGEKPFDLAKHHNLTEILTIMMRKND
jgi:ankyrin repeat protein